MASVVLHLEVAPFGVLPLIVAEPGEVLRDALYWAIDRKCRQAAPTSLYSDMVSVAQFHDYWLTATNSAPIDVYLAFFEKLVHGEPCLGWKGVKPKTADAKVDAVTRFIDWCAEQVNCENPNPKVTETLSWAAQVREFRRRAKSDPLAHLIPSTKNAGRTIQVRKYQPGRRARRGADPELALPGRSFSFDDYWKLIRHEKHPRERALWLLLGAGLRISEAMHLFLNDILFDRAAKEARVRLCDPTYGSIQCTGPDGTQQEISRQQYLQDKFGLTPRDQLNPHASQFAGWKGMQWHDTRAKTADVFWLHPYFGELMWKTHLEYLQVRAQIKTKHPYYFVNLKHTYGKPMTVGCARRIRELERQVADLTERLAQTERELQEAQQYQRLYQFAQENGRDLLP